VNRHAGGEFFRNLVHSVWGSHTIRHRKLDETPRFSDLVRLGRFSHALRLKSSAKYLNKPNPRRQAIDDMADRELFQLENTETKQLSKDLALVWRQFDRLLDIEASADKIQKV
jgi:hypothetical protein